jgi:hypothetical protein
LKSSIWLYLRGLFIAKENGIDKSNEKEYNFYNHIFTRNPTPIMKNPVIFESLNNKDKRE